MITNVESLAPAQVVAEILVAAIHNIAEQNINGHSLEAVRTRLEGNLGAIARAAKTYNSSIKDGKTGPEAQRDAALAVVTNYRFQHKL
ncbi:MULTISPECIES: hypothetical protein [Streptomyces]|uniref:hypothetical protein n=1 Tax=Streptomyces TaxID=1883 RepID=UPI0006ADFE4F|nr:MULTISPECIES: hypothetical protein [Streptomyces]KOU43215.1 hypothetical protein ADK54_18025 [Streptomyces sp. WM6378]GGU40592.1 hypothetical protein GCM10010289_71850 [Streptomyces violascens]